MRYRTALPALIDRFPPQLTSQTLALAEHAALELRGADEAGATGPSTVPLLRSESAASSKIEQIEVGQRHIARALAGYPTRQRAAREVAANIATVREALRDAVRDLTVARLNDIHRTLLPEDASAGKLRAVQNWIGGSDHSPRGARYVPPAPEDVGELVEDLCRFLNRRDLPAVGQAGIAHAQFEAIHPYEDGNGRVGRALIHRVLRRRSVVNHGVAPVSVAMLSRKEHYLDDLAAYDAGDIDTFVRHFATSAMAAATASRQLTSDLADLATEWALTPAVANTRSDATVRRLITDLVEHPVIDTNWVMAHYDVSRRAALNALDTLTNAGILGQTTAARGLHVYEAVDVLSLMDGIEGDLREHLAGHT
ncbi:MAG TPA: Fic family protein [Nitriliruptorales bacterium]